MKKEATDELISVLAPLAAFYFELQPKVEAAEKVFRTHPAIWEEYQKAMEDLKKRETHTSVALALEVLRTKLLQDQ